MKKMKFILEKIKKKRIDLMRIFLSFDLSMTKLIEAGCIPEKKNSFGGRFEVPRHPYS